MLIDILIASVYIMSFIIGVIICYTPASWDTDSIHPKGFSRLFIIAGSLALSLVLSIVRLMADNFFSPLSYYGWIGLLPALIPFYWVNSFYDVRYRKVSRVHCRLMYLLVIPLVLLCWAYGGWWYILLHTIFFIVPALVFVAVLFSQTVRRLHPAGDLRLLIVMCISALSHSGSLAFGMILCISSLLAGLSLVASRNKGKKATIPLALYHAIGTLAYFALFGFTAM